MKNVFEFSDELIADYSAFSRSFTSISASDIAQEVESQYDASRYWPEPLIQINANYQRNTTVQKLVERGILHKKCAEIFQVNKLENNPQPLHLYTHQFEAIAKAQSNQSYVVTTGTGSGKSLTFFIPVIDKILQDLNERWAFESDESLATSKFLILGKRPEYKGKPRIDLVRKIPIFIPIVIWPAKVFCPAIIFRAYR